MKTLRSCNKILRMFFLHENCCRSLNLTWVNLNFLLSINLKNSKWQCNVITYVKLFFKCWKLTNSSSSINCVCYLSLFLITQPLHEERKGFLNKTHNHLQKKLIFYNSPQASIFTYRWLEPSTNLEKKNFLSSKKQVVKRSSHTHTG